MGWQGEKIPSTVGEYRVERRIGAGGMGVVYLARSPSGRRVALKIIRGEFVDDTDYRARFRLEVAAARQVSGAFTAAVVGADPDGEPPWMATQYFDAPTLADRVHQDGPFEEHAIWHLGRGLAEALRDIHRAGLVHRDLKPSNVLLTDDGPRVIDFGIARALKAEPLTQTSGKILGTVSFMAPEQLITPRAVGAAADVFALGGVLKFAATGRGPFDGDSGASSFGVAMKIVHDPPNLTGLGSALRSIVEKCLLKDPGSRPSPTKLLALLQDEAQGARSQTAHDPTQPTGITAGPGPHISELTTGSVPPPPPDPSVPGRPEGKPARRRTSAYAFGVAAVALAGVLVWTLLPDNGVGRPGTADGRNGPSASTGTQGTQANAQQPCPEKATEGGPQGQDGEKITIGVTGGRPGMTLRKPDGTYTGLDVDVAMYIAHHLGYTPARVAWTEVSAPDRQRVLAEGCVDLLAASFTPTKSRSKDVDFSSPYLTGHLDLLLLANNPDIHQATDLSGKRVCTLKGSTTAANFKRTLGPKAVPVLEASVESCVKALTIGRVDAVMAVDTSLAYAATLESSTFKLAGLRLSDEPYAIGLPKGSKLKQDINAALQQMRDIGTMKEALHNHLPLLAP